MKVMMKDEEVWYHSGYHSEEWREKDIFVGRCANLSIRWRYLWYVENRYVRTARS